MLFCCGQVKTQVAAEWALCYFLVLGWAGLQRNVALVWYRAHGALWAVNTGRIAFLSSSMRDIYESFVQ